MKLHHLALALVAAGLVLAQPAPTDLYLRGYSVVPTPQKVALAGGDLRIDDS